VALVTCDFFSDVLEVGTSMTVLLPQRTTAQIGVSGVGASGPPPLLYLLHGLSDDHTAWLRYTAIGRYADAAGLAVVMPAVQRSFYANEAHGHRFWDFVSEELPSVVQSFFQVTSSPSETYVAGLSMGGYGALKLALTHPSRYAAAASLSGALDLRTVLAWDERAELLDRVFDGEVGDDDDLFALLEGASGVPPLHLSCGLQDPLLPGTEKLAAAATAGGVDVRLDLRPGSHEWSLWDEVIEDVIAWLPIPGRPTAQPAP
jgi:S-formylglutathione hydrolase FrmB